MATWNWVAQGTWRAGSWVTLWDGTRESVAGKQGRIDFSLASFTGGDTIDASGATSGVAFGWHANGAVRFNRPTDFTLSAYDDVLSLINKGASQTDDYALNTEVHAGSGHDLVLGGSAHDILHGEGGNDRLHGGGGADYIYGGSGNDVLNGGRSADWLIGDDGADIFDYTGANDSLASSADFIEDFQDGTDKIRFSDATGVNSIDDLVITGFNAQHELTWDGGASRVYVQGWATFTADDFIFL